MADAAVEQRDQPRAKVFISYSRKDMAFADRLDAALRARGFEPLALRLKGLSIDIDLPADLRHLLTQADRRPRYAFLDEEAAFADIRFGKLGAGSR